ncbi:tRNA modification GTPase TrmE [Earliella scabrosa]|nr:tRNA modification GTPase TrmE [Earliella scabrosa]
MNGRLMHGTRTAHLLRLFIHFPAATSYPLSRRLGTKNGTTHCPANAQPRYPLRASALQRSYSTAFSASGQRAGGQVADLVLSDAQKRTIYALSTPPGKAGVAVIRVSGPDASKVWRRMVKPRRDRKGKARECEPEPWRMHRCTVIHPVSEEVLDDGLAVFFKGPRSFTTEDVLELHVHSGRAIISSVLNAISCFPFCRPAERGEFTRRAFEGGRLDLTQVEGLRDLIDAETESQRKLALNTARGATRTRLEQLRNEVIHCLALVEALIDFGEGEEIEEGVYDNARSRVLNLRDIIQHHLSDNRRGEIMRSGIRLAIFGPPNAGKSSLLNFLAQREAAIVTPIPGTTRDILELSLDIGGLPVIVADTAGLRKTDDVVESIGVDRAKALVESSDVSLCVLSAPEVLVKTDGKNWTLNMPPAVAPLIKDDTLFLLNKMDLLADAPRSATFPHTTWMCSLGTGQGTHTFMKLIGEDLQKRYHLLNESGSTPEEPLITHARHRAHLESALRFLEAFLDTPPEDVVLAAEELRYAAQAIGKISGLIDVEDILDAVFRDFCIGK